MKSIFAASLVGIGLACTAAHAADVQKLDERIDAAHAVLHELMATPDKGIPLDIAAKAHCVAVIPGYKKGAFLVGATIRPGCSNVPYRHWLERACLYPVNRRQFRLAGWRTIN